MRYLLAVSFAFAACTFDDGTPGSETVDASGSAGADAADPGNNPDAGQTSSIDASAPLAACDGLDSLPADQTLMIQSDGVTRTFNVHVPSSYDPTERTPLVLNFHGFSSNAGQQSLFSNMIAKSDAEGFIAVHPDGISSSWNGGSCCGQAASMDIDDVGFVADMLDELEQIACVDTRRVYATGMSNGGFMSNRLGCELSDRIAAIAPVAGVTGVSTCQPSRPVPVMHVHGTGDTTVPYSGAAPSVAAWAARNGCSDATEVVLENGTATCTSYIGCDDDSEVTLCSLEGFGHWWPGAFGAADDMIATDEIWLFFERHSL